MLALDLKISGFVYIVVATDPSTRERFIVCQKPEISVGDVAPVKLSIPVQLSSSISHGKQEVKTWKMASIDFSDDYDDLLIDENELVDDVVVPLPGSGCGPDASGEAGRKRACANCSCGLKEIEAIEVQCSITPQQSLPLTHHFLTQSLTIASC